MSVNISFIVLEGKNPEVAKDIAMHVAAMNPSYLTSNDIPEDVLNKEREIIKEQSMNEGKPAEIAEKMVQGRIGKFYGEICLLEQPFVKEPDIKVQKLLDNNNAEIVKFARFERGEGLQKREENFAEEVAKQMNQ